ncbi:MAG: DUF5915 domain-containing protein, partial [Candidatus Nanoarchaeia archaeon]
DILEEIYIETLKLLGPIIPFVTESIWQDLKKKKIVKEDSVHLARFLKLNKKKIKQPLEAQFKLASRIIEDGLRQRTEAKIGLKWPLAKVVVISKESLPKEIQKIIARQLNVKKIELKKGKEISVELDTKSSPELEAEGYARELSRQVQAFRKKLGLNKKDLIELCFIVDKNLKNMLKSQTNFLKERTNSKKLDFVTTLEGKSKERFKNKAEFKVKDKRGQIVVVY